MQGQSEMETEALMFAFGTIHEKIEYNGQVMFNHAQEILETFVFPQLESSN